MYLNLMNIRKRKESPVPSGSGQFLYTNGRLAALNKELKGMGGAQERNISKVLLKMEGL